MPRRTGSGRSEKYRSERPAHVIVDRDGVLNEELADGWITSTDQWRWIPGSAEALRACAEHSVVVTVVTNQSGIGRGEVEAEDVAALHRWLGDELARMAIPRPRIFVCPHRPDDGCRCRKPAPGLVNDAIDAAGIDPNRCVLIGDDIGDIDAAHGSGIDAVLVRTGKGGSVEHRVAHGTEVFDNLLAAVQAVLGR